MLGTVQSLNLFMALGGVALALGGTVLLFDLYSNRSLEGYVRRYGAVLAFILTSVGSLLTLVYSEIFGFVPCGLCWFQRIFLYPQAFITGAGLLMKEKSVPLYGFVLSVPGLVIALYHHYIQMGGADVIGCPTSGGDCSKRILFEFGFVTFPLVSALLFAFLLVLYWYMYKLAR